jgi:hypothetical protein
MVVNPSVPFLPELQEPGESQSSIHIRLQLDQNARGRRSGRVRLIGSLCRGAWALTSRSETGLT